MTTSEVGLLSEIGLRLVPEKPTIEMCRAGCAIAATDIETIRRVYGAMLVVAADTPLHGDNTVN